MKVKLLKKVRKNYRIMKNGWGKYKVEKRELDLFLIIPYRTWNDIDECEPYWHKTFDSAYVGMCDCIHEDYSQYSKLGKAKKELVHNKDKWARVWYND